MSQLAQKGNLCQFIKSDDFKTEKHVPVIEFKSEPKAGQPFTVEVAVGKEIAHPNKSEHFIQWVKLYYKDAEGKFIYELGRSEFSAHGASVEGANEGPAYANPTATFNVTLQKPGMLIAESYCNIHGLWESSKELTLK